jgi:hypothetical protein
MSRISFKDEADRNSILGRTILECIGQLIDQEGADEIVKAYHRDGFVETKLTVNGVECDLGKVLAFFAGQFDRAVEERAQEIIEEGDHEARKLS